MITTSACAIAPDDFIRPPKMSRKPGHYRSTPYEGPDDEYPFDGGRGFEEYEH